MSGATYDVCLCAWSTESEIVNPCRSHGEMPEVAQAMRALRARLKAAHEEKSPEQANQDSYERVRRALGLTSLGEDCKPIVLRDAPVHEVKDQPR